MKTSIFHLACALIMTMTLSISTTLLAQENSMSKLMQKQLSDLPGREGVMLTVEYPPGSSSPKHKHEAYTFVYVLEGSVFMQVEGGEKVKLSEGEVFYENPNDIHTVSANASDTESAKILVFLVKKEGRPISIPVD